MLLNNLDICDLKKTEKSVFQMGIGCGTGGRSIAPATRELHFKSIHLKWKIIVH